MAKKYRIETFGCQMNVHDSERMAGLLDQAGYEPTSDDVEADVIVINTCSVREHAEEKLYTRLGELRVLQQETGRNPIVAVAGCVAQQEGDALLSNTNGKVIDVVVGTQRLKMLPLMFFEFIWKTIWILSFWLPLWAANAVDADARESFVATIMGVILFPIVIPWRYVWTHYIAAPANEWRWRGHTINPPKSDITST